MMSNGRGKADRRMRVGLTEMLEPEAKTDNLNLATGANREKTLRHRGGTALQNDSCLRLLRKG